MSSLAGDSGDSYRVIQRYLPQHDGEIELVPGDTITNAKDLSNGWTLGRNASRDTVGIFPSGFIVTEDDDDETDVKTPIDVAPPLPPGGERGRSQERAIPPPIAPKPLIPTGRTTAQNNKDFHKDTSGIPHTYERLSREGTPTRGIPSRAGGTPNDIYEDDLLSALEGSADNADLEEFNSGSLPSQKGANKGFASRKPHMFVRPNPSKNLFRDQSDSAAKLATSDTDMPDSPMSGGNKNYAASTNSTPVAKQQLRMGTPPRNQHGGSPRMRNASGQQQEVEPMDVDQPGTSGVIVNRATAEAGPGAGDHSSPGLTSLEQTERQNARNENLHRNSPKIGRGGAVDPEDLSESKFYQDYRTLECPVSDGPVNSVKYKPILKHRHGYYGSPGSRGAASGEIYYQPRGEEPRSARVVLAVLAGLLFGLVLFLWMNYALGYSIVVAGFVSVAVAVLLCILFAVSRLCRCVGALLLPSVCTTRGRIAFLVIITGFLLDGPVTNVYTNMAEVSRSMSCSAEQSYNQSMLLLQPFDAMMRQLNLTVNRLQWAAQNVSHGLAPLNSGLGDSQVSLLTGHRRLTDTERTCRVMIDRAFSECSTGILQAQEKCLGVIEALGTVYLQARDVLDRINPERWAPHSHVALHKRQVIPGNSDQLPDEQQDVCEPLDTITVCQALNDSDVLCAPSGWAGDAIKDAVNATVVAMRQLDRTLHFQVNPEPYYNTRLNATRQAYRVRAKVNREFADRTVYFHTVIGVLKKIVPVAVLLLVYVAYVHVKNYVSKDTYDNVYITNQFKTLDQKRCEVAGESLLPLKKYERNYLIDTTISELSLPEDGLYRIGLCVLLLHLLVSFTCYLFDYILFWILAMVQRHADPGYDYTGKDSLQLVITGEGVITDLLHVFLKGFHPANLFGYTLDMHYCLPNPTPPSILLLLVIFLLYFLLILTILLKAYILRFRNRITAFMYPDREKARIVHLYNVVLNHRYRMPRILIHRAKVNFREKEMREQISVCHKMAAKVAPCRVFLYKQARCLVCGSVEDPTFRDCQTERCQGVYCGECYDDINRVCPICHLANEYSDEEEYEDLEDDLQPYCRSSKIYV